MFLRIILHYKIITEVGYRGKDTTNSIYTLQGVPEQMSMRHFFSGTTGTSVFNCCLGQALWVLGFVRELISRLSSHLMLVTVSKSVRGMYVSKFKKSVHGWQSVVTLFCWLCIPAATTCIPFLWFNQWSKNLRKISDLYSVIFINAQQVHQSQRD